MYVGAESRENRQHYDRVEELSLGLRQTSRSLGLGDVDKPSEILSLSLSELALGGRTFFPAICKGMKT